MSDNSTPLQFCSSASRGLCTALDDGIDEDGELIVTGALSGSALPAVRKFWKRFLWTQKLETGRLTALRDAYVIADTASQRAHLKIAAIVCPIRVRFL